MIYLVMGAGGETVIIQCDTYYIGSALRGLEKKGCMVDSGSWGFCDGGATNLAEI